MRKPIALVAFLILVFTGIQAQTDYVQWMVVRLKPKAEQISRFEAGLTAHNKKYHTSDPYKAYVFTVNSGPGTGSYMWVMGPITFTQMEARAFDPAHESDWNNNVAAHCESTGEIGYWRLDQETAYTPEGATNLNKSRMRWVTTLPGQADRYHEQMKKISDVYKMKKYKSGFALYTYYGTTAGPDAVASMDFEKWSFLDEPGSFVEDFESVHGAGSWDRFLEEIALCVDRKKTYDEFIELLPAMSATND